MKWSFLTFLICIALMYGKIVIYKKEAETTDKVILYGGVPAVFLFVVEVGAEDAWFPVGFYAMATFSRVLIPIADALGFINIVREVGMDFINGLAVIVRDFYLEKTKKLCGVKDLRKAIRKIPFRSVIEVDHIKEDILDKFGYIKPEYIQLLNASRSNDAEEISIRILFLFNDGSMPVPGYEIAGQSWGQAVNIARQYAALLLNHLDKTTPKLLLKAQV